MALTSEERQALFETISSDSPIEDRAEAIEQIRAELNEETTGRNTLHSDLERMTDSYNKSQTTIRNLQNSLPQMTQSDLIKKPAEEPKPPEKRGFSKLMG